MDPADRKLTSSYGSSSEAVAYRLQQQRFLSEGRLMEAVQMDIDDVRNIANKIGQPGKYDAAIREMQDNAKTLNPNDFIPK